MNGKYDDIIDMPHHVSNSRPKMSVQDRAAQFSPFAALTGYESVIHEAARLTDQRAEWDEGIKERLDLRFQLLIRSLRDQPVVSLICFLPDTRKAGGSYQTITGVVKKVDEYQGCITMKDHTKIRIPDVVWLEGELFKALE